MVCIDVGAYVGDTVAFLRQEAIFPILCIEGNEQFYKLLEHNMTIFPEVELVKAYLHSQMNFPLETSRDLTTACPPSLDSMSLTDVLQRYPRYAQAKMLKIDTDGHDGIILRGAEEFLSMVKPILFFEYDPDLLARHGDDGLALLSMLRTRGYTMALFYENIGTYMLSTELENTRLLKELHQWFSGYGGHRYYDLCLFHHDDADLGERIRLKEIVYFQNTQRPK
jgi:FkbM family methyltransferase